MSTQEPNSGSPSGASSLERICAPHGEYMELEADSELAAPPNNATPSQHSNPLEIEISLPEPFTAHTAENRFALAMGDSRAPSRTICEAALDPMLFMAQPCVHDLGLDVDQAGLSFYVNGGSSTRFCGHCGSLYDRTEHVQQHEPCVAPIGPGMYSQGPTFDGLSFGLGGFLEPFPDPSLSAGLETFATSLLDLTGSVQSSLLPNGTGSSTSGRRGNQSLPKEAIETLKSWFYDHIDNPYPTSQEKEELAEKTGLEMKQINTWFTNSRSRRLSSSSNTRSAAGTPSRGRSVDMKQSSNAENSCTTSRTLGARTSRRDRSPRRGRKRSVSSSCDRGSKRSRSSSLSCSEREEDSLPCTICWTQVSQNFASWKRHEQECFRLQSWTCPSSSPICKINGQSLCIFCNAPTPLGVCDKDHRIKECSRQEKGKRTFYRKFHLARHFRTFHTGAELADRVAVLCMTRIRSPHNNWPCGFCCLILPDFDAREKHVFRHLQNGMKKEDWFESDPILDLLPPKINEHQRNPDHHSSLLSGFLDLYVCGERDTGSGETSWGCHRPFQGIIALAQHFRSPFGKVCMAPLFKFGDEEVEIDLSKGRRFHLKDFNHDQNVWKSRDITDTDSVVSSSSTAPSFHDGSPPVRRHIDGHITPSSEPSIQYWKQIANRDTSEKITLPRRLYLKYPALAQLNWSDVPQNDEIDLLHWKIHNGPLSTIISRSTDTRSVTTRTLPSHQTRIDALLTDQSEIRQQVVMSTRPSAPPPFPETPRDADFPAAANSPASADSPASVSSPLSSPGSAPSPLIGNSSLQSAVEPFNLEPSDLDLAIRPLQSLRMIPVVDWDEGDVSEDVEMSESDIDSTSAICDDEDDEGVDSPCRMDLCG